MRVVEINESESRVYNFYSILCVQLFIFLPDFLSIYILSCIGTLLYLEGILLFAFQCQFTLPFL